MTRKTPRCGVLFTGEYLIGTGSDAARLFPVEMQQPDGVKLKYFQDRPLVISTFYYFYISWFVSHYYKEEQGVVKQCCYYDRQYKWLEHQVLPPMLISCFFPYTKQGILTLLNHEICCDFTHILVTDGIDLDSNHTPLCGAV